MKVLTGIGLMGALLTLSACGGGGGLAEPGTQTPLTQTQLTAGALQLSASSYSASEGQMAVVTIQRVGGSSGALTASLATSDGTAKSPADYTATTTTVTFADGDVADKTVSIPTANDHIVNPGRSFTVTLSSGATKLGTATVAIQDDDSPGVLQFNRTTYSTGEGGGTVAIVIDRINGSAGAVSVTLATQNGTAIAGQDFTTTMTTVSFGADDTASKTVNIPILTDTVAEGDETFTVTLSTPTGGAVLGAQNSATVTIVANDAPPPPPAGGQPGSVQLGAATLDVSEAGGNAVITVSRVGGSVGTVSVRVSTTNGSATAGTDYTAVNTTVTFANGDATDKFVNIPILNDSIAEADETFTVTLSNFTGGATQGTPTSAVVTILDDDAPAPPALTLSTDIRQIQLNWPAVATTTVYRLYANPDGVSGFTQIGGDLTPATLSFNIDVVTYKFNWKTALYRLEACNAIGCTGSASVGTINALLGAIGYFKAAAVDANDLFGSSVAMSADGNTLVVGAPNEDSNATGIGGNSANNAAADSGAAYVFARTAGAWAPQAYLKASNSVAGIKFGSTLAIASDGNTLAVGAPGRASNAGAAYVFVRSGATWSQQAMVVAPTPDSNDAFGTALGLSGNGNTLVVGAPGEASNANTINGSQTDNSAAGAGAAYVFTRSGATWTHQTYLKATNTAAGDAFGSAVTISGDGNTIAIGASLEDSDATTVGGDQSNNNALDSGAVYVFVRNLATWLPPIYLKSGNSEAGDRFGVAVSLSNDGNTLAIGASGEDGQAVGVNGSRQADNAGCVNNDPNNIAKCDSGAAYVFVRNAGVWSQQAYIKSSNSNAFDTFGAALALSADGNSLIVGAINEDSSDPGIDGDQEFTNAKQSGAAYLFTRSAGVWSQRNYFKATNPDTDDVFGTSVAIDSDGNSLSVGATGESSNAVDIDGNAANNSVSKSGAAYLY